MALKVQAENVLGEIWREVGVEGLEEVCEFLNRVREKCNELQLQD